MVSRALLAALLPAAAALSLTEMSPIKAAMLARAWQTDQSELDQKVGRTDGGYIGVMRFGDDLERRTACASALDLWVKTSLALAAAEKGGRAGPRTTCCYAALGGVGPNTLSMVKKAQDEWTLNFLFSNPNERDRDAIAAAEAETLAALAREAGDAPLKLLGSVEKTLVSRPAVGEDGGVVVT
mmetsp:Transcript_6009/g.18951  ORF Transcript_6009/g.18951 Transcript_6009/m.18951 type:complete len:183 (+) Transcript_6009:188-736(+)